MKKIVGIVVVIVASLFIFLAYSGLFTSIAVNESELGPFTFVYEQNIGPYHKTGPVFERVNDILKKEVLINPTRGLGVYYDDPAKVPGEKQRSDIGSVIEPADIVKAENMRHKMRVREIPRAKYAVIVFPFRNRFSIVFGAMRAYQPLYGHVVKNGYSIAPAMEIYDRTAGTITYAVELKK